MKEEVFTSSQTQEIISYISQRYGDKLEFLWPKFSRNAIWRNRENRKWYAVLLIIPRNKLTSQPFTTKSEETTKDNHTPIDEVEIIDLRFPRNEALDFAESNAQVYPGYHMNKNNWITIILDGSMETNQILRLLDQSYNISLRK